MYVFLMIILAGSIVVGLLLVLRGLVRVLFRPAMRADGWFDLWRGVLGVPVLALILAGVAGALDPQGAADFRQNSEARSAQLAAQRAERSAAAAAEEQRAEDQRRAAAAQAEASCRQDLQCWGDRHLIAAAIRCEDGIERLALYTMEWTDGILEPKFSRFRWSPLGDGILVYIGDTARFQNGFGAWQNMVYECTYDPATEQALDANARPGRL